jgi:hypothetical protein
MPLLGTRDIEPILGQTAVMPGFDAEPLQFPGASILQVLYEIHDTAMLSLLPPALHPTIPPTIAFVISEVPESPFGPFTLAEARVGCRAGARPRGFVGRCFASTARAAAELGKRWGYPAHEADVRLKKGYDRITGTVAFGGRTILTVALVDPEAISGGDIQYLPAVNLARVERDGGQVPRIVQVDPEFRFHKADRGKAHLDAFDAAAWLLDGAAPYWPVSASCAVADVEMPVIRYVLDPLKPAVQGVERVH